MIFARHNVLMGQTQQVSAFLLNPVVLWLAPNGDMLPCVTVSSGALPVPDGVENLETYSKCTVYVVMYHLNR